MSRRIFILLIVLMGTALVGIIAVQIYWINNSIEIREKQFSNDVKFALAQVSEVIQEREFDDYYKEFSPAIDSLQRSLETGRKDFFFQQYDTVKNEVFTFRQSILENSYKPSVSLFDNDTVTFKTFFSEKQKEISKLNSFSEDGNSDLKELSPEERIRTVSSLPILYRAQLESAFKDIAPRKPIYDRISYNEIKLNLYNELRARGVEADFEFGVYNEGLATKLKSEKFRKERSKSYGVPLFVDNEGGSDYQLFVSFPGKEKYIIATISNILIFAAVFILIIILAFASALYQLIRQKQISEIKTDFINNMTHEFKTPIATINLALDAIKNPKIINDKEKILRYTSMIRQENKRMHGQVENVLRISKLEKNQLDLTSKVIDIHEVYSKLLFWNVLSIDKT